MKPILRKPAVKEIVGLSDSTIYLRMARNEFPRNIPIGGRLVGWRYKDIEKYIEVISSGQPYRASEHQNQEAGVAACDGASQVDET